MGLVHVKISNGDSPRVSGVRIGTETAMDVLSILAVCNKTFEYSGSDLIYVGYTLPGYGLDEPATLIFKSTYDAGKMLTFYAADGELELNKVWNDRATYTYTPTGA